MPVINLLSLSSKSTLQYLFGESTVNDKPFSFRGAWCKFSQWSGRNVVQEEGGHFSWFLCVWFSIFWPLLRGWPGWERVQTCGAALPSPAVDRIPGESCMPGHGEHLPAVRLMWTLHTPGFFRQPSSYPCVCSLLAVADLTLWGYFLLS